MDKQLNFLATLKDINKIGRKGKNYKTYKRIKFHEILYNYS